MLRGMRHLAPALPLAIALLGTAALADDPVIEQVTARQESGGWRFDVTISHPDSGWEHYADGWRVLGPDGRELGLRVLLHPHDHEQPFTRALSGVAIPDGVRQVQIQARCIRDGWAAATYTVDLD